MAGLQRDDQSSPGDDLTSKQDNEIGLTPLPVTGATSRNTSRDETVSSPGSSSGLGSSKQSESNISPRSESVLNILHPRISMEELRNVLSGVMENNLRSYAEQIQAQFNEKVSGIDDSVKKLQNSVTDVSKIVGTILQNLPKADETKARNPKIAELIKSSDSLSSCSSPSISARGSPDSVPSQDPSSQNSSRSQSTQELSTATLQDSFTKSTSTLAVQSYAAFPAQCTVHFEIPCLCQLHHSTLLPLIDDNKLYLFLQAHESSTTGSKLVVKGCIEQYSLDDGRRKDKKNYTNCKRNVCPTMLFYLKKVTIVSGDNEVETRNVKLTIYQFNASKAALEPVVGSKYSSTLVKLKNAVCVLFNDGIIVVSVLDQLTQHSSSRMTFHLFSQVKTAGKNWKMASLLLPSVLHSHDSSKYQIQSCVVISNHVYCSLLLHETTVYIYKINLSPLCKYDKEYYEGCLSESIHSWVIEDLFITGCLLSILKEEVVITTFKDINNRTLMEVRLFNSANPTSPIPKPTYCYDFPSVVKGITVSVVSDNSIAVIYHDNKTNKCYTLTLKM